MPIQTGDKLPHATLLRLGEKGPEDVDLAALVGAGPTVLFGVPGAFTGTCSTSHVPSFIEAKDAFAEAGAKTIICVSVNDPFVMDAWSKNMGADEAGIHMLADPEGALMRAMDLQFSAPEAGLFDRARRFAMMIEDGVITTLNVEENPGVCEISTGQSLLDDWQAD